MLVVGITGFFLTREYFLYQGVENFKKSVLVLQRTQKEAASLCQAKIPDLLNVNTADQTSKLQIRFTSSKDYVLEVLCPTFQFAPVVVQEKSLDMFVTKTPGASGIVLGPDRTGVELVVFERLQKEVNELLGTNFPYISKSKPVVLEGNNFIQITPAEDLGSGPIASCEGFGYQCCQPETHIGVGDKLDGLPACETTCYSQCVKRPIVLTFTSNPFFDVKTKTTTVSPGETVDFSYLVDPGDSDTIQVELNYGDGETQMMVEKNAMGSHVYNCELAECTYVAKIRATDQWGIDSADTSVSRITIKVEQN